MRRSAIWSMFLLHGCSVVPCIDAQIERAPKPVDEPYVVRLYLQGHEFAKTILCEEYYDAMCAERGNYWSVRETGAESQYEISNFDVHESSIGRIEIPVPSCTSMFTNQLPSLEHVILKINGQHYWLVASDGYVRTYNPGGAHGDPENSVGLELSMSVNGQLLGEGG